MRVIVHPFLHPTQTQTKQPILAFSFPNSSAIVPPDAVMRDDHRTRSPHRGWAESRERDFQGQRDGYNRSRQGKP